MCAPAAGRMRPAVPAAHAPPAGPCMHGPEARSHATVLERIRWRSERRRVLAEDVLHRGADLADRAAVLQRLADRRQEVVRAARDVAQLLQAQRDELLVAL